MASELTWDLLGWVDEFPSGPVRDKLIDKVREDGGAPLVDAWQSPYATGRPGRAPSETCTLLQFAAERPDLLPGGVE